MFFIIWRGWGFLAPLILFGLAIASALLVNSFMHEDYALEHQWVYSIGILIGSVVCGVVGKRLRDKPGKVYLDERTGRKVELKKEHSCYFIPFEYWAYIGIVASIVVSVVKI